MVTHDLEFSFAIKTIYYDTIGNNLGKMHTVDQTIMFHCCFPDLDHCTVVMSDNSLTLENTHWSKVSSVCNLLLSGSGKKKKYVHVNVYRSIHLHIRISTSLHIWREKTNQINIWGICVKIFWKFFVLFSQLFWKSEITSKIFLKRRRERRFLFWVGFCELFVFVFL